MRPLEQFYYRQQFDMPYQSEVILDMIAEGSWTISDVLSNVVALQLASPATAFKYMSWLRDNGFAYTEPSLDRKSTRLNSSHVKRSRMPSSA